MIPVSLYNNDKRDTIPFMIKKVEDFTLEDLYFCDHG